MGTKGSALEKNRYVFFECYGRSVKAFYPNSGTHVPDPDRLKALGLQALETARARRACLPELAAAEKEEEDEAAAEDDSDTKSDAGTGEIRGSDGGESEYESSGIGEALLEEGVQRKLKLLAEMAGVDSGQPADVLTEVVKVLRDMEEKRRSD